jgi:hypothetical protein
MASNRIRALRNVSNRLTSVQSRLGYLNRRPSPRRLADNFIFTNNIRRLAIVNPLIDSNAVENDNLADDSVDSDQILKDAITGKNINSCDISNSKFTNGEIKDSSLLNTQANSFVLTNGSITQTTLTGAAVILTECQLLNCRANEIFGIEGLTITGNGNVGIGGSGVSIDGGGSLITVASGNIGIGAGASGAQFDGANVILGGFQIRMNPGWDNVRANGIAFWSHPQFTNEIERLEDLIESTRSNLQSQINGKANIGHSH